MFSLQVNPKSIQDINYRTATLLFSPDYFQPLDFQEETDSIMVTVVEGVNFTESALC
jgi:hypothetical protein